MSEELHSSVASRLHGFWDMVFIARFRSTLFGVRWLISNSLSKRDNSVVLLFLDIPYDPFCDSLLSSVTYGELWFFITGQLSSSIS